MAAVDTSRRLSPVADREKVHEKELSRGTVKTKADTATGVKQLCESGFAHERYCMKLKAIGINISRRRQCVMPFETHGVQSEGHYGFGKSILRLMSISQRSEHLTLPCGPVWWISHRMTFLTLSKKVLKSYFDPMKTSNSAGESIFYIINTRITHNHDTFRLK